MAQGGTDNQALIRDAVAFLRDPKVISSPLTQRISFLESKGLSPTDIETALLRASTSPASSVEDFNHPQAQASTSQPRALPRRDYQEYAGTQMMMRPELPRRDWRDFFIMAVVSGGVMYGMVALARKYLLPHLRPPTTTSFQQTSTHLSSQFDEAAALLADLQSQTTALQESVTQEREKIDAVVEEVAEATRAVKGGEERWREEMRELRDEVGEVRELVPKILEKHAQTQASSLQDLQNELKSLKTLLLARRPGQSPAPASSGNGTGEGVSSTESAANALLAPRTGAGGFGGKPGIPSWQLANGKKEEEGKGVEGKEEGTSG